MRCGGGIDVVEAVGRGGAAGTEVRCGGGASALVWIRMYVNAWAYIRKYVSKGALRWGRGYG